MTDPIFLGFREPNAKLEAGAYDSLANFGYNSPKLHEIPANLQWRRILYDNLRSPWGEYGPKWGIRAYNAVGRLGPIEFWRVGDWTKGREGHAVYLNAAGDLDIRGLSGVQCGGQLLQIVWRASETLLPVDQWPSRANTINIANCRAEDCGAINVGNAVRASWPMSIFSTGANVVIEDFSVRTALKEFVGDRGETFCSHGVLLVTEGDGGRRMPSLTVNGLFSRLKRTDRDEIRLCAIDRAELCGLFMSREDGGIPVVSIVDNCGSVRIYKSSALTVRIRNKALPWASPVKDYAVSAGMDWRWPL